MKEWRCIYLYAALCVLCMQHMHGVSGQAIRHVSTAADLKAAITGGARDIEVIAHLDLTQLAPGMSAVFDRPRFRSFRDLEPKRLAMQGSFGNAQRPAFAQILSSGAEGQWTLQCVQSSSSTIGWYTSKFRQSLGYFQELGCLEIVLFSAIHHATRVLAMQGSCGNAQRPAFAQILSSGAEGQRAFQCVLNMATGQQLFSWPEGLPSGAGAVWIDNVFVRATGASANTGNRSAGGGSENPLLAVGPYVEFAESPPPGPGGALPPPASPRAPANTTAPPEQLSYPVRTGGTPGGGYYRRQLRAGRFPMPPASETPHFVGARRRLRQQAQAAVPLFLTNVTLQNNGDTRSAGLMMSAPELLLLADGCAFQDTALYGVHAEATGTARGKVTLQGPRFSSTAPTPPKAAAMSIVQGDLKLSKPLLEGSVVNAIGVLLWNRANSSTGAAAIYSDDIPNISVRSRLPLRPEAFAKAPPGFLTLEDPRFLKEVAAGGGSPVSFAAATPPGTPAAPNAGAAPGGSGGGGSAIVGGVVGGIVALLAVAACIAFAWRKKHRRKHSATVSTSNAKDPRGGSRKDSTGGPDSAVPPPAPPPSRVSHPNLSPATPSNTGHTNDTGWTDANTFQRLQRTEEPRYFVDPSLPPPSSSAYVSPGHLAPITQSGTGRWLVSNDSLRRVPQLLEGGTAGAVPPPPPAAGRHQWIQGRPDPLAGGRGPSDFYDAPPPQPLAADGYEGSYSGWRSSEGRHPRVSEGSEDSASQGLYQCAVRGSDLSASTSDHSGFLPVLLAVPNTSPLSVVPESANSSLPNPGTALRRGNSRGSSSGAGGMRVSLEREVWKQSGEGEMRTPSRMSDSASLHAESTPQASTPRNSSSPDPAMPPAPAQPVSSAAHLLKSTIRPGSRGVSTLTFGESELSFDPTDVGVYTLPNSALRPPDPNERLHAVLRHLEIEAAHKPHPELFAGRYVITGGTVKGGQSVVAFARGAGRGFRQYAIKFFTRMADYVLEVRLFKSEIVAEALPALIEHDDNLDGTVCSSDGFEFPPFVVMDRGTPLSEWKRIGRQALSVLGMLAEVTTLLQTLHRTGQVHRDVKPGNILLILHTSEWRFIDFGIMAKAGRVAPIAFTLAYAAPEAVLAFSERCDLVVHPSLDVWGLGVLAYECLASFDAPVYFKSKAHVERCARGEEMYPWELPNDQQPVSWRRSRAKDILLPCLERDFRKRPTAGMLLSQLARFDLPLGRTTRHTAPIVRPITRTEPLM